MQKSSDSNLADFGFQEEVLEKTLMMASVNGNKTTSLYESLRHTGAANLLENLQAQLKMKEGEILQLQVSTATWREYYYHHLS